MKKQYVVTIEIVMEDDDSQKGFGNINIGNLDLEQKYGNIESWDFRDVESAYNIKQDGTVDRGE